MVLHGVPQVIFRKFSAKRHHASANQPRDEKYSTESLTICGSFVTALPNEVMQIPNLELNRIPSLANNDTSARHSWCNSSCIHVYHCLFWFGARLNAPDVPHATLMEEVQISWHFSSLSEGY